MTTHSNHPDKNLALEQLLRRSDVWRGQSQKLALQAALDTGHDILNAALLHKGWPLANLVEVCQANIEGQSEWLLMAPALRQLTSGYTVLLNPPAMPFAAGLIQLGLDLNRLLIVQTSNKNDFLTSFVELARTEICAALLAWQPKQNLSYTELRKCLLAAADHQGLTLLFRPASVQKQSSPAVLRIMARLSDQTLALHIFKQKGWLGAAAAQTLHLPLPETWMPAAPYAQLDQTESVDPVPQPDLRRSKP
jgi:protein ImuA